MDELEDCKQDLETLKIALVECRNQNEKLRKVVGDFVLVTGSLIEAILKSDKEHFQLAYMTMLVLVNSTRDITGI